MKSLRVFPRSTADRPLLIAHRGLPLLYPENSASGFEAARRMGAEVVELDVRPTSDGALVVLHDEGTERVTGVPGLASDTPSAEVFSQRFLDEPGEGPISLDQALAELGKGEKAPWIDIEIKDDPGASPFDLVSRVADSWMRGGRRKKIAITSTSPAILRAAKERLAEIPRGLVFGVRDERDPIAIATAADASLLVVDRRRTSDLWIEEAQLHGWQIWVYTVNDLEKRAPWRSGALAS